MALKVCHLHILHILMKNNYWLVINTLRDAVIFGENKDTLNKARLALSMELDRRVVGGTSSDETLRLLGVLDELSDKIAEE